MTDVKRYTVTNATGWLQPWPTNLPATMVLASDYDALAAENAALRERLAEEEQKWKALDADFSERTEALIRSQTRLAEAERENKALRWRLTEEGAARRVAEERCAEWRRVADNVKDAP